MQKKNKFVSELKSLLQVLAVILGGIPLCLLLGYSTAAGIAEYVLKIKHDSIISMFLFFFPIFWFATGFWMYTIFFLPRWAYDLARFKRMLAREGIGLPISCDAFYGMEPDQGGFETLEFQRGAIFFSSGAIFETRNRVVFNYVQKGCTAQNPEFRPKQCPLTPSEPMGWYPPEGFVCLD